MSASTFRIGDGQPVAYETAKHLWAKSAREVLIEKAREYGGAHTDEELAAEVQRRTAVKTRVRTATWIDEVLAEVVAAAHAQGEPLLAALCVREDGREQERGGHGGSVQSRGVVGFGARSGPRSASSTSRL